MTDTHSRGFELLLTGLEEHRKSLTDKRKRYTKNLVGQTNEEARSGMPYIADVARLIAGANVAELFVDMLINGLRSDSRTLGESTAVKRALSKVFEELKSLDAPGSKGAPTVAVSASELHEVGGYLMTAIRSVEIRGDDD